MNRPLNLMDALKTALISHTLSTQEDIRCALERYGYYVNQSKISRLLRKVGAVKATNERKQIVYALPREPSPPGTKNVLSHLVVNIDANENMVIVNTNPGSASLIARLLDHHQNELKILGTVAGDDTVFVAPRSTKNIVEVMQDIQNFLSHHDE